MSYYPTTCDCSGEVVYGPAQCHTGCPQDTESNREATQKKYGMLRACHHHCIR